MAFTLVTNSASLDRMIATLSADLTAQGFTVFMDYDFAKLGSSEEKIRSLTLASTSGSIYCIDLHCIDRIFARDAPLKILLGDNTVTKVVWKPKSMLNCLMDKFLVVTDAVLDLSKWSWFKDKSLSSLAKQFMGDETADRLNAAECSALKAFDERSIDDIRNALPVYQGLKVSILRHLYQLTNDTFRVGAIKCLTVDDKKGEGGYLNDNLMSDSRDGHVVPWGVFGSRVRVLEDPVPESFQCELCRKTKMAKDAKKCMWFKGWHRCKPCCTYKWQQMTKLIDSFVPYSARFRAIVDANKKPSETKSELSQNGGISVQAEVDTGTVCVSGCDMSVTGGEQEPKTETGTKSVETGPMGDVCSEKVDKTTRSETRRLEPAPEPDQKSVGSGKKAKPAKPCITVDMEEALMFCRGSKPGRKQPGKEQNYGTAK